MTNWAPALSIADLASEWAKETGETKLESALAHSVINGQLKVSDPVMDNWRGAFMAEDDDLDEEDACLRDNENYGARYYPWGELIIFNIDYWEALFEIATYGTAVRVNQRTAEMALSRLFIKKEDFNKWLKKSDRKMPIFWLTESERSTNSSTMSADKLLTTTERNTLLIIIAALCSYSDIKHQDRGAAGQIAKLTEENGAAVTDDTIRKVLKDIPNALEARTK